MELTCVFRRPPWRRLLRVWPRERDYYSAQLRLLSKTLAWLRLLAAEAECHSSKSFFKIFILTPGRHTSILHTHGHRRKSPDEADASRSWASNPTSRAPDTWATRSRDRSTPPP